MLILQTQFVPSLRVVSRAVICPVRSFLDHSILVMSSSVLSFVLLRSSTPIPGPTMCPFERPAREAGLRDTPHQPNMKATSCAKISPNPRNTPLTKGKAILIKEDRKIPSHELHHVRQNSYLQKVRHTELCIIV